MKNKKTRIIVVMLALVMTVFGNLPITVTAKAKSLKVLAIGNSFSENALMHLYPIAKSAGYEDIKLGNLYIAGCTLQTHWSNANTNRASYKYDTNTDGSWESAPGTSILTALQSEDWDYIVFQQASPNSGQAESFEPYLGNLINYINANKTTDETKLAWHMTWAYAKSSTHAGFANYNRDQDTMYNAIIDAAKDAVVEKYDEIDLILPSGTVIQNLRTAYIEDDAFTSDGYHLSQRLGCFAASLTWFAAMTGESIDNIKTDIISENLLQVVKEGVNNAIKTPYSVTKSSFTTDPTEDLDFEDYDLLNWEPVPYSYWNSTSTHNYYTAPTVELNTRFICSKNKLTKEDIPVGSVIWVDPGYQYRAEKWPESGLVTTTREPNTGEKVVFVTESWWGNWEYVTFNLSKLDSSDISKDAAQHSTALKIYIPKIVKAVYSGNINNPEIESKTATKIELKLYEGYEYSIDGKTWQTKNIFDGLTPDSEYDFYCRVAETKTTLASSASEVLKVTTLKSEISESSSQSTSSLFGGKTAKILIYGAVGVGVLILGFIFNRKRR